MKKILILSSVIAQLSAFSQNSAQEVTKEKDSYAFAQIFAGFYYGFKDTYKPQAAFVFNQGILGYYHELSDKVSGKIMFDVTRTTNFSSITDTGRQHAEL